MVHHPDPGAPGSHRPTAKGLCGAQLPDRGCHHSGHGRPRRLYDPDPGSVAQLSLPSIYPHPEGAAGCDLQELGSGSMCTRIKKGRDPTGSVARTDPSKLASKVLCTHTNHTPPPPLLFSPRSHTTSFSPPPPTLSPCCMPGYVHVLLVTCHSLN